MRRLALAIVIVAGVLLPTSRAHAHAFTPTGPAHTDVACDGLSTTGTRCNTWILANGTIFRGPTSLMQQQYGYVLVRCSYTSPRVDPDGFFYYLWIKNTTPYGPWGNTGAHAFCQEPKKGSTPWPLTYP